MKPIKTKRVIKLFNPLFPQQKAFCDDPAKLKALFCTRRAAKSFTFGLYAISEALKNSGCNILLVGLTRTSAKKIFWKDILKVLNKKHGLRAKFNINELTMTLRNGSVIALTGVDASQDEMKKQLGAKLRLVCIDEASMYNIDVRNLVYGVLKPAMVDPNSTGQRGVICIGGTASNMPRGLFYDITKSEGIREEGWSLHKWTAHDNPYVAKQWQEELDEIRTLRPLYMETPQYRQWFLNQWVVDENKLVYKYSDLRNVFTTLPYPNSKGWTYNLGVDTGWEDDNAFVLAGYHENDPTLYIISVFKKNHMNFYQVEGKIREYLADARYPIQSVIIDGANKQGVQTMNMRGDIQFTYADKLGKSDHIEICNGDLIQGRIKIHVSCQELIDEMLNLVWRTDGDKIKLPRKENESCPNHLCDAFLYNWYGGFHFLATPAKIALMPGTIEYNREQETLHKQAICERIQKEQALKDGNKEGTTWVKTKNGRDPWNEWD